MALVEGIVVLEGRNERRRNTLDDFLVEEVSHAEGDNYRARPCVLVVEVGFDLDDIGRCDPQIGRQAR
jgi:hypothetical protein